MTVWVSGFQVIFMLEGVDGGDGADAAVGEIKPGAEGIAEGAGGGLEEEVEEIAAFAEDAAEDARDGKNELPVGHFMADRGGNPGGKVADAALVAGGAEVAALAGEGEEVLVPAIRAAETGKPAARSPQRRKLMTTAKALARSGPMAARWTFS